jgi:hypothetical protein
LNLLSPRTLPKPGLFSTVDGGACGLEAPSEKLPKAPIGDKLAVWEAAVQGEEVPAKPLTTGFVALRFKDPNGEEISGKSFGLSFSSNCLALDAASRRSVLRRRREGGGVVVLGSSRKKREPAVGDMGLPVES